MTREHVRPGWDREGRERVVSASPETNRGDGDPRELGPLPAGAGAVAACHYPAGEGVRIGANRVVTGGKSGLRANGGKDLDKKIARVALVTAW